jgi:hypothetical protein
MKVDKRLVRQEYTRTPCVLWDGRYAAFQNDDQLSAPQPVPLRGGESEPPCRVPSSNGLTTNMRPKKEPHY